MMDWSKEENWNIHGIYLADENALLYDLSTAVKPNSRMGDQKCVIKDLGTSCAEVILFIFESFVNILLARWKSTPAPCNVVVSHHNFSMTDKTE